VCNNGVTMGQPSDYHRRIMRQASWVTKMRKPCNSHGRPGKSTKATTKSTWTTIEPRCATKEKQR